VSAEHVVIVGNKFICRHCNETHAVTFPIPMSTFAKQSNAFTELHRDCKPSLSKERPL